MAFTCQVGKLNYNNDDPHYSQSTFLHEEAGD